MSTDLSTFNSFSTIMDSSTTYEPSLRLHPEGIAPFIPMVFVKNLLKPYGLPPLTPEQHHYPTNIPTQFAPPDEWIKPYQNFVPLSPEFLDECFPMEVDQQYGSIIQQQEPSETINFASDVVENCNIMDYSSLSNYVNSQLQTFNTENYKEYLHVTNIPYSATEEQIVEYFEKLADGVVESIYFSYKNGYYTGKAKIVFLHPMNAQNTIKNYEGKPFFDRHMRVRLFINGVNVTYDYCNNRLKQNGRSRFAKRTDRKNLKPDGGPLEKVHSPISKNILITNLHFDATVKDLEKVFGRVGEQVVRAHIHYDSDGRPLGSATINFRFFSYAKQAVKASHVIFGRHLRLHFTRRFIM